MSGPWISLLYLCVCVFVGGWEKGWGVPNNSASTNAYGADVTIQILHLSVKDPFLIVPACRVVVCPVASGPILFARPPQ